jgi:hypothetical protein
MKMAIVADGDRKGTGSLADARRLARIEERV